ncbi:GpE family phage tail protein [Neisseria weixii]|uniref:GpE family phage tail protein n=1 Tax=Neisseria weixii TaxID=1853276 RepID=UPI001E3A8A4E|nr:GpE family phage tail protein [Neisseria weixii]
MSNRRSSEKTTVEEAVSQLTAACADMAWWYGWSLQAIDNLTLDDFEAFQKEATRQMKAGFRKGV